MKGNRAHQPRTVPPRQPPGEERTSAALRTACASSEEVVTGLTLPHWHRPYV
jgi:hypothetical protein